ncbi:hypothetical protein PspLS_08607 [Pyricularia sp. CBS 133598]|nr:hypothetical protein PspLS_08607 [Pyricularia sp. CBS 133598]
MAALDAAKLKPTALAVIRSVAAAIQWSRLKAWLSTIPSILIPTETEKELAQSHGLDAGCGWLAYLPAPILVIGVLALALVFGLLNKSFALSNWQILGVGIDEDAQIAFFGLLNKVVDLLVQLSLEKVALLYATRWIIQPDVGATVQDVEQLKAELTRPWVAVASFHRRRREGVLRFLLCLAVSVGVLFLGVGMNTVAWPKKRWYPDAWASGGAGDDGWTVRAPLTTIERVDWADDLRLGLDAVGGVPELDDAGSPVMSAGAADELAGGLSAAGLVAALARVPGAYSRQPRDWYFTYEDVKYVTGVFTGVQGSSSERRSMSLQTDRVMDLFNEQRKTGNKFARGAIGMTGTVNITVPLLTTACFAPVNGTNGPSENSISVSPTASGSSSSFSISIGPSQGLSFPGAICNISISQVLFPVFTWIVDMPASAWVQINKTSAHLVPIPPGVDTQSANARIATQLAAHTSAVLPMLNGLAPSHGIVPHLVLLSRQLQVSDPSLASDASALGAVVGVLAQHQLTAARWTARRHDDTSVPSSPVRFQIYGSGPRLAWEWAAATFLAIVILAMAELLRLVARHRITVPTFLSLGGMLRIANASEKLDVVEKMGDVVGGERKKEEEKMDALTRLAVIEGSRNSKNSWPMLVEVKDDKENSLPPAEVESDGVRNTDVRHDTTAEEDVVMNKMDIPFRVR